MEQSSFAVIIAMIIVFIFIPAFYLRAVNSNNQLINDALYFAARSLEDCVSESEIANEQLALGYIYADDPIMRVKIDEAKLLTEFEDVLFRSINNATKFNRIQRNIVCKILIYPDRYVILDDTTYAYARKEEGGIEKYDTTVEMYNYNDEVQRYYDGKKNKGILPPKYFTYSTESGMMGIKLTSLGDAGILEDYYINTANDKIKKIKTPEKSWANVTENINDFTGPKYDMRTGELTGSIGELTTYDKNQCIINTINRDVKHFTNGTSIRITNPANTFENNAQATRKDFNFFKGITFLIVYKEEGFINVSNGQISLKQYNVAGYTLEN